LPSEKPFLLPKKALGKNAPQLVEIVRIPKERVGALIGSGGETKQKLQQLAGVKISVDSETGEVELQGKAENAENFYNAVNVVKAIGRGFSPQNAMLLLGQDFLLDVIKVSDIVSGGEKTIKTRKGRVIGRHGKAREIIERETDSKIAVFGKTVAIIAKPEEMPVVRKAVEMLLQGAEHSTIFRFLQKKRIEEKKFSI
jgi:ribosomal RNA assembly protein